MTTTSRENATKVSAGRVRPVVAAAVYGALQVLCMLAVLAANAVFLHAVSPGSPAQVALVVVAAALSLAAFPFLVRAARRRLPAPQTPGAVAAEVAGTLLAMLLPALLLFAAGRAEAQQTPGGMNLGDGPLEAAGPQVRVGGGCVNIGNLEVGGCEDKDGRNRGSRHGGGPDAAGGPDASSDRPTDRTRGGCEPEEELARGKTTALEPTTGDPSLSEGGCEEDQKDLPEASGEEKPREETDGGSTTTGTPPAQQVAGCPVGGPPEDALAVTVERVVDGDTLEISGEAQATDTVRLIGVDAPETVAPEEDEEPFGEEASAFTREALEGDEVLLEPGEDEEDQYGRLLAYAWKGEELFNATLVEGGYAEALAVDPNTEYRECLEAAERRAKRDGRGLWGLAPHREDVGGDPTAAEDQYGLPHPGGEETTVPAPEPSGHGGEGPWGLLRDLIGGMSGGDDPGPETTVLERTVIQRQIQESTGGAFGQELTQTDFSEGASPSATPSATPSPSPEDSYSGSPDAGFGLSPRAADDPAPTASPGASDIQYEPDATTASPTPSPRETLTTLPETGGLPQKLLLLLPAAFALLAGGSLVLAILHGTDPHAGDDEDRG